MEDVAILAMLGGLLFAHLPNLKIRYYRHYLNPILLVWIALLLFSVIPTLVGGFDGETRKNAAINGIRLALAWSAFFIVYNHPASADQKMRTVVIAVIGFSLITTAVSLLQVGHSAGLPLPLPSWLVNLAPGANSQRGREVFALFVGDTNTHSWAGMLALQALLVSLLVLGTRSPLKRIAGLIFLSVLLLLLARTAVRNALIGLIIAFAAISLVRSGKPAKSLLMLFVWCSLGIVLILGVSSIQSESYFLQRALAAIPRFDNGRLVVSAASSIVGRLDYYLFALQLFLQEPLIGNGFYSYQALARSHFTTIVPHAHNTYLQILAEAGVVGFAGLSLLVFGITTMFRRSLRIRAPQGYLSLAQSYALGAALFLGFTALFGNTLEDPKWVGFFAVLLGALASYQRERWVQRSTYDAPP